VEQTHIVMGPRQLGFDESGSSDAPSGAGAPMMSASGGASARFLFTRTSIVIAIGRCDIPAFFRVIETFSKTVMT